MRWALLLWVLLVAACAANTSTSSNASASTRHSTADAKAVTGGATCSGDQQQDLTFSGSLSGHIACATAAVTCGAFRTSVATNGLAVPVRINKGSESVLLSISVNGHGGINYKGGTGSFSIRGGGGETSNTDASVSLDGPQLGHWDTQAGGAVVITVDSTTGKMGTINATIAGGAGETTHLTGSWRCAAPA